MKIGSIIKYHRKKENLTQEQIASCLNISTPAVNKWENGMSYPDISLLAPLARILKIDINTLLEFNDELTDKEMVELTKDINTTILKDGYDEGFSASVSLILKYPNCYKLIFNIATILRMHLNSYNGINIDKYKNKIISWFELVSKEGRDKTALESRLSLSAIYIEDKKYDNAQELLDKIEEPYMSKSFLQAKLYIDSGKIDEAYRVYEKNIFKCACEINQSLSLIIQLLFKEDKLYEARKYSDISIKAIELFDLGDYNKHSVELALATKEKDKEKTIGAIIDIFNKIETIDSYTMSKLYSHMEFNKNSTFKTDFKKVIKKSLKEDENFNFVKDDFRIKSLLE